MELPEPEQRAGDEETLYLAAAEIVDAGVPIPVKALAGVLMLVQRRTIEARQAMRVVGEMSRHPIEDHAEIGAVAGIDEPREALGRAEAGRWRELRKRLISPRAAERMFHDRQQLDVGESQLGGIGDQAL